MNCMENTLQMIKNILPEAGTELGSFTFLAADRLWTGETDGIPYVVVAEDRWPCNQGGFCLAVTLEGAVYVSDLDNGSFTACCASGFSQFIEILKLYQSALNTASSLDMEDEECDRHYEELEQTLLQQIMEIDAAAIEDTEGFWSTCIEELISGV